VEVLLSFSVDVTEQIETRQRLRKRRRELQSIIDHTPAIIYVKDLEGRYISVNEEWLRYTDVRMHSV
jgi:PAS domain-containing protein